MTKDEEIQELKAKLARAESTIQRLQADVEYLKRTPKGEPPLPNPNQPPDYNEEVL